MSMASKVVVPALLLLLLAAFLLVETVPPRSLTSGRMLVTKRRITQFARQHNKLPSTLDELPSMPGYDTQTTDAWSRPLDYTLDSDGFVTLRSLGADKRPGGDGDNRDMIGIFASRDTQGNWQEELAEWNQDPFRHNTLIGTPAFAR